MIYGKLNLESVFRYSLILILFTVPLASSVSSILFLPDALKSKPSYGFSAIVSATIGQRTPRQRSPRLLHFVDSVSPKKAGSWKVLNQTLATTRSRCCTPETLHLSLLRCNDQIRHADEVRYAVFTCSRACEHCSPRQCCRSESGKAVCSGKHVQESPPHTYSQQSAFIAFRGFECIASLKSIRHSVHSFFEDWQMMLTIHSSFSKSEAVSYTHLTLPTN